MSVDGFPQGKTEIRHKKQYITPSVNLYGLIVTVDDNGKDKKILLSYINRKTWNKLDNVKAGEYKLQVGDNIISLTDRYIKIKSDNLFINGMPYVESKKVMEDHKENEFLDMVYPVGSIYMSMNSTNPHKLFGGEWERLKDTFLLASGDIYNADPSHVSTAQRGSATVSLTQSQMPRHTHTQNQHQHKANRTNGEFVTRDGTKTFGIGEKGASSGTSHYSPSIASDDNWWGAEYTANATATNKYTGGVGSLESESDGVAHENMPPYMSVYMWKRTG